MRIYVDADGFPKMAKDILIRAALRLRVPVQPVLCFLGDGLEPPMTGCGCPR